MDPKIKKSIVAACRRFMRPIARLLIRSGVTSKEFGEISKAAFVEVAGEDYGLRGRPTNTSRVAILTGLSRKEVRRIRETLADELPVGDGTASLASRVLGGWFTDADFLDGQGKPLTLAVSGNPSSFAALLKRYGGDMPPGALLKELKKVGAIREITDGRLQVLTRYYMPAQLDPAGIERSASVLTDFGDTVVHNLLRDEKTPSRFEGRASNRRVSRRAVNAFRKHVEERGEEFLYAMDDWLSEHETGGDNPRGGTVRLGVGLYLFEETGPRRKKKRE